MINYTLVAVYVQAFTELVASKEKLNGVEMSDILSQLYDFVIDIEVKTINPRITESAST